MDSCTVKRLNLSRGLNNMCPNLCPNFMWARRKVYWLKIPMAVAQRLMGLLLLADVVGMRYFISKLRFSSLWLGSWLGGMVWMNPFTSNRKMCYRYLWFYLKKLQLSLIVKCLITSSLPGNKAYLVNIIKNANLLVKSTEWMTRETCELACITKADCVIVDYNAILGKCSMSEHDNNTEYSLNTTLRSYAVRCDPDKSE